MKKLIALLLAAVMCLSLVACGGDTSNNSPKETSDAPTTETPGVTEYSIGEAFGTDSVECVVTEVKWVTLEDVTSHPAATDVRGTDYQTYKQLMATDMFPGYSFYGMSGFSSKASGYPYLVVTFTLQNVGKTVVEPTIQDNNWGAAFNSYGNVSVIYDDGYTFDAEEGFNTTLEILGDAFKEGRIFEVPSQVYENEDKALKVKITLPNANGEIEEFIVSVR